MSDVIYVLLTIAVFVLLAVLVGVLDRRSGVAPGAAAEAATTAVPGASSTDPVAR